MIMSRILTLGLLAMTMAAGAAYAGEQAQFHLPFEARWGGMTLSPGDYNVALPQDSLGIHHLVVRNDQTSGYIQPTVTDPYSPRLDGGASYLELVNVNGTYFISAYKSAVTGRTFSFSVPKQKRQTQLAKHEVIKLEVSGN